MVYKSMDEIVECVKDTADIVAIVKPIYTLRRVNRFLICLEIKKKGYIIVLKQIKTKCYINKQLDIDDITIRTDGYVYTNHCDAVDRCSELNKLEYDYVWIVQEITLYEYKEASVTNNGVDNNWTLCSKRLPEHTGYYLVTTIYGSVEKVKFFHKVKKWNGFGEYQKNVIAWHPMVEPYIKEKTERGK